MIAAGVREAAALGHRGAQRAAVLNPKDSLSAGGSACARPEFPALDRLHGSYSEGQESVQ